MQARWWRPNQTQIMGIVNLTPDSFSDGGRFKQIDAAITQALQLEQDGAAMIDLGGESTRPGAQPVSPQEEMDRVLPVLEKLRSLSTIKISVDTSSPQLMTEAAALGADLINDVRALTRPGALAAAAATGLPICLMHMRSEPDKMQQHTQYQHVVTEVQAWLTKRIDVCTKAGIATERLLLDPGFGFAKQLEHNLSLLAHLSSLTQLGWPILVGMSRKKMLGEITGQPIESREAAGLAAHLLAAQQGASWLRVHQVANLHDALKILQAVQQARASRL